MDHGILNLPLSKRGGGSIDAQIDRYKKSAARERAGRSKIASQARKAAAAALKAAPDSKLVSLAGKLKLTLGQTRAKLKSECISSPHLVLSFLTENIQL